MNERTSRAMTEQEEMEYEMRAEYDLSEPMPNPYPARARARAMAAATGGNLVMIEAELFEHFPGSEAVNEALRSLLKLREQNAA